MAKKKSKKSKTSKGSSGASTTAATAASSSGATAKATKITEAATGKRMASAATGSPTGRTAAVRDSRRKKQQRTNTAIIAGIATVVVAAIAMQVVREMNRPGERFASQGNVHLVSINSPHVPYNSDPPTSGPHMPTYANWGSYTEVIEDEYLVHNMEDAGVVLWYDMGTPEENEAHIAALEEISRPWRRVIIVPRENLGSKYVFTAWTRLQRFDEIDEAAMTKFIDAYEGIDHHPR